MEVSTSSASLLPYEASSVGVARRRLVGDLDAVGACEVTVCDAGLVLSELVSNALRHGSPLPDQTFRVSWRLGPHTVRIAVSDGGGPTAPTVADPGKLEAGGRGLGIVERLSLRWGVRDDGGQTTVWAELPVQYADSDRLVTASAWDA
jgi:anti-sigma regulatory factor (Ser/Thr protein kinase)